MFTTSRVRFRGITAVIPYFVQLVWRLADVPPDVRQNILHQGSRVTTSVTRYFLYSSFGDSRMYRRMYDKAYYTRMQEAALTLWQGLEKECGQRIISAHGLLFYGDTDTGGHLCLFTHLRP